MRRCSKCDLEKEDNKFYTYYHSTQRKNRTRKICNECIAKQKAEYKKNMDKEFIVPKIPKVEIPIKFKPEIDHQFCQDCEQWLHNSLFYPRLKIRCRECECIRDSIERAEKRAENGGSAKVRNNPNTYVDIYQKQQTFDFMKAVGYTFNEEKGIWYKLPWKDQDGNFPLLDTYGNKKCVRKSPRRSKHDITQEEKDEVIRLYNEGYKFVDITKITGTPNGTVWRWVEKHKLGLGL